MTERQRVDITEDLEERYIMQMLDFFQAEGDSDLPQFVKREWNQDLKKLIPQDTSARRRAVRLAEVVHKGGVRLHRSSTMEQIAAFSALGMPTMQDHGDRGFSAFLVAGRMPWSEFKRKQKTPYSEYGNKILEELGIFQRPLEMGQVTRKSLIDAAVNGDMSLSMIRLHAMAPHFAYQLAIPVKPLAVAAPVGALRR